MLEVLLNIMINALYIGLAVFTIRAGMIVCLSISNLNQSLSKYSDRSTASSKNHLKHLKRIKKERF